MKTITLEYRINQLIVVHGSLSEASKQTGIDKGYLSRLAEGKKMNPGPEILGKLGLKKVVSYVLFR